MRENEEEEELEFLTTLIYDFLHNSHSLASLNEAFSFIPI